MSQSSQPGPPQRIGDVERDQAAEFLREHHAQGRLDASEFDDRITRALSAKWQSDLDQLFVDLPAPAPRTARPAPQPPIQPPQQRNPGLLSDRTRTLMDTLSMVIWPVAIIGMIALHGHGFALILIAILVTTMWRRRRHQDNAARARLASQQEAERRRLEQERRRDGNGGYGSGGNGNGGYGDGGYGGGGYGDGGHPWGPSS